MKKIFTLISSSFFVLSFSLFTGCGTTTTTTTFYKEDGKTIDRVEVVQDVSDVNALANYLQQGDSGNATDRALDITRFSLGYGDVGLSWLSIGGNSTKAPATATDADKVLSSMADVKKAGKTTIQTEQVGVNSDVAKSQTEPK